MDYLAHHGVKGQKWGVRRQLDEGQDGSLRKNKKGNFGTSKLVRGYAGKSSAKGIVAKTIAAQGAISIGATIASRLLSKKGHKTAASLVSDAAIGANSALTLLGITASVQRGRGRI